MGINHHNWNIFFLSKFNCITCSIIFSLLSEVHFTYIIKPFFYNVKYRCNVFPLNTLPILQKRDIFMNLNRVFAMRLSTLLNERKMSKYKLEQETGLSHSALRYIFNEINTDVKFSTIVKVCQALNLPLTDFFDDKSFNLENLNAENN